MWKTTMSLAVLCSILPSLLCISADHVKGTELLITTAQKTDRYKTAAPAIHRDDDDEPQPGNWSFIDSDTKTRCILVQAAIKLRLEYNSTTGGPKNITLNIPTAAKNISGNCKDANTQTMHVIAENVNFTFVFERNSDNFDLAQMDFTIALAEGGSILFSSNGTLFKTPVNNSYYCQRPQIVLAKRVANIMFSQIQLEAFHTSTEFEFSDAIYCPSHDMSSFIKAVVGIALGIFIAATILVYLWIIKCDFSHQYEPLDEESITNPRQLVRSEDSTAEESNNVLQT